MEKIAIIGAGISGVLACKHALDKGFSPVVFEAKNSIGGVWHSNTIASTKLQTPKNFYQFSDFEWPSCITQAFPSHDQVLQYINSYALRFNILPHVKFNSKVISIDYHHSTDDGDDDMSSWDHWGGSGEAFSPAAKWSLLVQDLLHPHMPPQVQQFGFVILCMGKYSDSPNVPQFPVNKGPEVFHGKAMHSMDYAAMGVVEAAELVRDKRVAVVGFQKSALDIASEVAQLNGEKHPCTLIYKTKHWAVPDYLQLISFRNLNRFSEFMIHKPDEGFFAWFLAIFLSPLLWMFSKAMESYLKWIFPLKEHNMVPKHSYLQQIASCMLPVLPDGFYHRVKQGSIVLKELHDHHTLSFCKTGLITTDNNSNNINNSNMIAAADVVIFATGYRSDEIIANIFVSPQFQKCITQSTSPFYRECIHPQIPQLAILGYPVTPSVLFTTELKSKWVAHFLAGGFKLPPIPEMEKSVAKWQSCMLRHYPRISKRDCFSVLLQLYCNDQLCKDMNVNPRRNKGGFLAQIFSPYSPSDYADLI